MVNMINQEQPDLVLLGGDVIDSSIEIFSQAAIKPILSQLKPKYGVYAVPGNHEYISGKLDDFISQMNLAGIRVLRDERVTIADSFYIVGRDEPAGYGHGQARQPLADILAGGGYETAGDRPRSPARRISRKGSQPALTCSFPAIPTAASFFPTNG